MACAELLYVSNKNKYGFYAVLLFCCQPYETTLKTLHVFIQQTVLFKEAYKRKTSQAGVVLDPFEGALAPLSVISAPLKL